jgi:hypothetical protein
MSINSLDRRLSTLLKSMLNEAPDGAKRVKVENEFREIRRSVVDQCLGRDLEALFSTWLRPKDERQLPPADEGACLLKNLGLRGFRKTAGLVFREWSGLFIRWEIEAVLEITPDADELEAWRKAACRKETELQDWLVAQAAFTYGTVGLEWLFAFGKPALTRPLLELLCERRERPRTLPSWAEALESLVEQDKRGLWLEFLLRHPWPSPSAIESLAEVVRRNPARLRQIVELLPVVVCKKDAPESAVTFVQRLFTDLPASTSGQREFLSAALARLGTGIVLQERRGSVADAVLKVIGHNCRSLRSVTREEDLQKRSWVFENLAAWSESITGRMAVTLQGARQLAIAIEKASQGLPAKELLYVTARNMGMTLVGTKGDITHYDSLVHEDVTGGLVPGESVNIEESGLALGQDVIVRARVRRNGGSNV